MKTLLTIFILLSTLSAQAAADKNISAVELNNQAVQEILKDTLPVAQDHLIQALGKSPENSSVHLNLGLVLEKNNQADKAQASYEQALKFAKTPTEKFNALFDLGQLSQKGKKTDEALNYYQQALNEDPQSKETKINIELLMKQQEQQKDKKDQNKDGQGNQKQPQQNKDNKDNKDQKNKKNQDKPGDQPKQYGHQQAPKPQFKSDQLNQADVNKILGELKQQEQRIRTEYNRKEVKERPNDKDW